MSVTLNASTSSGLVQTADTSGTIELQSNGTTKLTVSSSGVNIGQMNGGAITAGTAVTASSTAVQFASIPSWVQRITLMIQGVSTNGTVAMRVQLGTGSTPTYSATYVSIVGAIAGGTAASSSFTDGFAIQRTAVAAALYSGTVVCTRLSTNVWTYTSNIGTATSTIPSYGGGSVDLGAVATAIRLYIDGTDTFDAGSINILYEG
jgi:hypothetical protein